MTPLELALLTLAFAAGLAAGFLALWGRASPRAARWALALGAVALLLLAADRWRRSGHPPLMGTFEAALLDTAVLWLVALGWLRQSPPTARAAASLGLPGVALLAHGLFFPLTPVPLTISERSLWVDAHVAVASLALALYLCAGAAAAWRLATTADAPLLDEALHRFGALGFLFHTAFMASGAWYANILFGSFWRWDAIEAAAAVSWLALGLALHARLFFRWTGRRLALALLVALLPVLVVYEAIPHLGMRTFHHFDLSFDKRAS
jgi:ABC-type transport system involved in cytochrome c biogenesis permease subunit